MRTKEFDDLEQKTRTALASLANGTPVTDRWSEVAATVSGSTATVPHLVIGDDPGRDGDLDGEDEFGTLVELGGRRRLRLLAAVAAALVVLGGALVVLDRARPSSRPTSPGVNDPRFPKEPAHLLPASDPESFRVHGTGYRRSVSRRFTNEAGTQLMWTASPVAMPDPVRLASDHATVATTTIADVDVTVVTETLSPSSLASERAAWARDGISYWAYAFGGSIRLADVLPELLAATAERPPSPPSGLYAPKLLDNVFSGVSIDTGRSDVDEIVLWPIDHAVTVADFDAFEAEARQYAPFDTSAKTLAIEHLAVNGRAAIYVPADPAGGGSATVLFSPVDGTMALVSSADPTSGTRATLLALAEGLHAVDDATWDAARYGGSLLVAGTTDGTPWSIAAHGDSCAVAQPTNGGTGGRSCTSLDPASVATAVLQNRLVAVIAPASATRLGIAGATGSTAAIDAGERRTFSVGSASYALWIVAPPRGVQQLEVVAIDAAGRTIGERQAVTIDTH